MQIVLANSFFYGSIHHQRAMEIMTNLSFQKPFIHQKVSGSNMHTGYSIEVKWNTGCAIRNIGCPLGINELMTLPQRVVTNDWNCFFGNVRNLLAVLGQCNDVIENKLSALMMSGNLGCNKGNLIRELGQVIQAAGYHTFFCDVT